MVKKLLTIVFIIITAVALSQSVSAEEIRVYDEAGLFSESEIAELEEVVASARTEAGIDIVILTSESAKYSESDSEAEVNSMAYADDFYDQNSFGDNGVIYFIDMSNRIPTITTKGTMINYLTNDRYAVIFKAVGEYLGNGDYFGSAKTALTYIRKYVKDGIPEGQYNYDYETGEILTESKKMLTLMETVVSLIVSLAVFLAMYMGIKSRYNLKNNTYRYDVTNNSVVDIKNTKDDYLRSNVTSLNRESSSNGSSNNGSGSSSHTSSSGSSHGGSSGGRF